MIGLIVAFLAGVAVGVVGAVCLAWWFVKSESKEVMEHYRHQP